MTMEATGRKIDQVYVLRQTFRPNGPFQAALANLISTGSSGSRPFSIVSSVERVMDMSDVGHPEFNIEQREADKYLASKQNTHLEIEHPITGRAIRAKGSAALQLVMNTPNLQEFYRIRQGLQHITYGTRRYAPCFKEPRLYVNIPFGTLLPVDEVKETLAEINHTIDEHAGNPIYQVAPLPYLSGQIMPRPLQPTENKE